ncbi:MAG: hypothetical protein AAFW66_11370, partial [Pseudomonadota bacterium]
MQADNAVSAGAAISCGGALTQGGLIICEGPEGTTFTLGDGGVSIQADENGATVFGLGRFVGNEIGVTASAPDGRERAMILQIAPRNDQNTVINGIPCDKIDARTPEQKAQAAESWQIKQDGWARFNA